MLTSLSAPSSVVTPPAPSGAVPASDASRRRGWLPSQLATATIALAAVWMAMQLLSTILAIVMANQHQHVPGGAGLLTLRVYNVLELVSSGVLVAAWIVTSRWLSRSRELASLLAPFVRHTRDPIWTWLGWAMPVVSFWFPFQVVRDVHRATVRRDAGLVTGWWTAFLMGAVLDNLSWYFLSTASASEAIPVMPGAQVVVTVVWSFALALWISVVREITGAQKARVGASWADAECL
jgi:hypothetical protein